MLLREQAPEKRKTKHIPALQRQKAGLNGPTIDRYKNCSNKKKPIMNGTSDTFKSSKVFDF